ncbi:MAG: hypothetical protein KBS70_02670, partial [Bacteroidales bacterium]|nr:hypothetical protein [Candidatus Colicola equi]
MNILTTKHYDSNIRQFADELAARARFKAVAAAIKVRKLDPNKTRTDAAAFKEQSTYKTMYAYLWH